MHKKNNMFNPKGSGGKGKFQKFSGP